MVRELHALDDQDLGENHYLEAQAKSWPVADLDALRWPLSASCQGNKGEKAIRGTPTILCSTAVPGGCARGGRCTLDVFVQESTLQKRANRGECGPQGVIPLVDAVLAARDLRLRGNSRPVASALC